MELKIWVEGIQRIVCGVTANTTCQDVVFALAHATGQVGRFTLIERWRNNERLLAPNENPLKLLTKWGEYANDVQFLLKRIELNQTQTVKHQQQQQQHQKQQQQQLQQQQNSIDNDLCNEKDNSTTVMKMLNKKPSMATVNHFTNLNKINNNSSISSNKNDDNNLSKINNNYNNNNSINDIAQQQQKQQSQNMESNLSAAHERAKEFKKCFGPVDSCMKLDNVGIVKGVPQNNKQNNYNHNNNNFNSNDNEDNDNDDDDDDDDNMSTVVYMNSNQYYEMEAKTSNRDITVMRHKSDINDKTLKGVMHHPGKCHSNPMYALTETTTLTSTTIAMAQQQQQPQQQRQQLNNFNKTKMKTEMKTSNNNNNNNSNSNNNNGNNNLYQHLGAQNSKSINEINLAEVRNALDRGTTTGGIIKPIALSKSNSANIIDNGNNNMNEIIFTKMPSSMENLMDIFQGSNSGGGVTATTIHMKDNQNKMLNSPIISANGALVPPPYRDPPPPRQSPLQLNHGNYNVTMHQQHQQHQQSYIPITTIATNATTISDVTTTTTTTTTMFTSNSNSNIRQSPQTVATTKTITTSSTKVISSNSSNLASSSFIQLKDYPHQFNSNGHSNNNLDKLNENDYEIIDYEQFHTDDNKSIFPAAQYHELLQLINYQREKINAQQKELNKYDAEIVYLEAKERDQAQELETISREINLVDQLFRQGSEQLQTLQYVEEENELVKQQEKTLKSEIALLRSKLSNCETELLQCKNKIRLLMDDMEIEQRTIQNSKKNKRQHIERDFLMEMERIQSEIDQAIHNTDTSNKSADNLKKEILLIENAIAEKKRQVEQLVNEMKEVNLQSLTVTTSDEIKHFLEGSNKPGSSRRIIGSPRQLENAVPTSKNPHGVWV